MPSTNSAWFSSMPRDAGFDRLIITANDFLQQRSRREIALFTFVLVLAVGIADYASGVEVTLSVVYAIPILLASWYVGPLYALVLATVSVVIWVYGDIADGFRYSSILIPVWNGAIRLFFYAILITLLARLQSFYRFLEDRVNERAEALTHEIRERERLERDLLEVSEREQRRIGQDLHDGLCQQLTGTAILGHVLAERLGTLGQATAAEARKVVGHIEDAISLARGVAKGLHPVEMQADGLMQALEEFAGTTSEMFGVSCRFECDSPVLLHVPAVATNLYRIAQEAVGNAIKHGHAGEIVISLENSDQGIRLTIADNGPGLPDPPPLTGMGLRIMADRARVIGGAFSSDNGPTGGCRIHCLLSSNVPGAVHV